MEVEDVEKDYQNVSREKSVDLTPMDLDKADDSHTEKYNRRESVVTNVLISSRGQSKNMPKAYLTKEEFDYTMKLIDGKIAALYKLCRFISEQQQDNTKSLKRLVMLDELFEGFWNVSYSVNTFSSSVMISTKDIYIIL
jgi:hypothetical protein